MKSMTHLAVFAAASLAAAFVPASLHASVLYVGSCGGPNKPTIQAAVNASQPGGTVLVCPGTYPEQVTITKDLTVQGLVVGTAGQVVITSPASGVVANTYDLYNYGTSAVAAQVLVQNARQVVLNNITVDGNNNGIGSCVLDIRGIYYQNASGTIENVTTRNQVAGYPSLALDGCQTGQGIFVQSGYGTSSTPQYVAILGNSVRTFAKNGITVDGSPLNFLLQKNYIVGQGPTTGAAENGVQISDGATGQVLNNTTIDEIWEPDTPSQPYNAASGILVYSSANVEVGFNTVGSTQFGIVTISDPSYPSPQDPTGSGDHTNIHDNSVLGTQIFDGLDVCSNNNTVINNSVFSSTESGIHLDSTCGGTGKNNVVSFNTINDACAGILQGGTPNTLGGGTLLGLIPLPGANTFYNDATTVLAGDVCPVTPKPAVAAFTAEAIALPTAGTGLLHPTPVR
jgi:parallel beta-helix repeat protein